MFRLPGNVSDHDWMQLLGAVALMAAKRVVLRGTMDTCNLENIFQEQR